MRTSERTLVKIDLVEVTEDSGDHAVVRHVILTWPPKLYGMPLADRGVVVALLHQFSTSISFSDVPIWTETMAQPAEIDDVATAIQMEFDLGADMRERAERVATRILRAVGVVENGRG